MSKGKKHELVASFTSAFKQFENALKYDQKPKAGARVRSLCDAIRWENPEERAFVLSCIRLRNIYSHPESTENPIALPVQRTIDRLAELTSRLRGNSKIEEKMSRNVRQFGSEDPLEIVLLELGQSDYSQFPVHLNGRFKGLLTVNGISRWFAKVFFARSLDGIMGITAGDVLQYEEKGENGQTENFVFVALDTLICTVHGLFSAKPMLWALLVTEDGRQDQPIMGIYTRWQVPGDVGGDDEQR